MPGRADGIIGNGWGQWVCFSRESMPREELLQGCEHCDLFLVATQSCDLAHGCFVSEPYAEVFGVTLHDGKAGGNYVNAKNSRVLHLDRPEEGRYIELKSASKLLLDRQVFDEFSPGQELVLSDKEKAVLVTWVSSRYYRPAFSEEYMEAWGRVIDWLYGKLKKHYDSHGDGVVGVFVSTAGSSEDQFESEWLLVFSDALIEQCSGDPERSFSQIQSISRDFQEKIKASQGITGVCSVKSTDEFTLEEMRGYKRVFLDDICMRGEEVGSIPGL